MRQPVRRTAFTLIEMLVVIAIILMLAGLVVAFMPGVSARQQAERGAQLLRTNLLKSKYYAQREKRAAGIRFIPAGGSCKDPLFIQKPDDFGGGTVTVAQASLSQATLAGADLYGNPILPGDSLEVGGSGLPHLIASTYVPGNATLPLVSSFTNAVPATSQYRIMRAPRPLIGEPPIGLPQDVGVDLTGTANLTSAVIWNGTATPLSNTNPTDVLFAPSGQVAGAYAGCDMICLWVRDTVVADPKKAFPILVVIYGRTGFITQHPVSPDTTAGPYEFALKARSSGM